MTTVAEGRSAILSQFFVAWQANTPAVNGGTVPEVRWQGVEQLSLPDGSEAWARAHIQHNDGNQTTFGSVGGRRFRRIGIVTIQIFVPLQEGLTLSDALVKIAMDAFEGQHATLDTGVWFRNVRFREVGPDGPWFQANVLADFVYDNTK